MLFESSKAYFFILVSIVIASSLTPFALIFFTSTLIQFLSDNIGNGSFLFRDFIFIVVSIFLFGLLNKALEHLKRYYEGLLDDLTDKRMDELLMDKSAKLDVSFFDSTAFYDELKDLSLNKSHTVSTAFLLIDIVGLLVRLSVAMAYLSGFSPALSVFLLVSIVPNVLLLRKQFKAIYHLQRDHLAVNRKKQYTASLLQERGFAQEVKLYNLLPFLAEKYKGLFDILYTKKKRTTSKYTLLLVASSILPELISIYIISSLCLGVFCGTVSIGDFTYYQGIVGQVMAAMFSMVYIMTRITDGSARVSNCIKFLGWKNMVRDDGEKLVISPKNIEFSGVSFRYHESLPYVLKKLDLTIGTGAKTAFVGANGSGKSTIVKLLLRFYDPCEGEILIDGANLKEYSVRSVREYFGIMLQDYGKYAFSVKESVSLSDTECMGDVPRVVGSLRDSGAYGFVEPLKDGIDTYLTRQYDEGGVELSGGQWQTLALSRAFFRGKAGMLILDEPSSALDAETEEKLFRKFEELHSEKGAVIISHRLSNISSADRIYVLHDGAAFEQGTHDQLMALGGKYAAMFRTQAKKYEVRV